MFFLNYKHSVTVLINTRELGGLKMKKGSKLLATTLLVCATASIAYADDVKKVQSYGHPGTFFEKQAQELHTTDSTYIVGGKILRQKGLKIQGKNNVLVDSWAKDVMSILENNGNYECGFNAKMPVLRSELAVILSEGFNLKNSTTKQYKDITNNYWAKKWIDGALDAGVMIGYTDNNFRPDQPVTKAEVFATIAQLIDVKTDKSLIVPNFKNKAIQYIPNWAIAPTKEVVASNLLNSVPNPDKVNNDEYLSKEQVAYLVGALRMDWASANSIGRDGNASAAIQNYAPTAVKIQLQDRLSARQSNIGDKFSAKTTADVCVNGTCFPAGSLVKGEVVAVERPSIDNTGFIKVKFTEIKNGDTCAAFPNRISQASTDVCKNPNFIARLLGFPFSGVARVAGVSGRTISSGATVISNSAEQFADNVSNVFVNTASLKPVAGLKSVGNAAVTVGKGIFDIAQLAVNGTFGVLYEAADEIRYVIVPAYSNDSSLNPSEENTIVF